MLIQDLTKDLDVKTMTAVRGGDNGNSAVNRIGQQQSLYVPVAVDAYGPANTNVHVNGTQRASIWNDQDAGDSFKALFPSLLRV